MRALACVVLAFLLVIPVACNSAPVKTDKKTTSLPTKKKAKTLFGDESEGLTETKHKPGSVLSWKNDTRGFLPGTEREEPPQKTEAPKPAEQKSKITRYAPGIPTPEKTAYEAGKPYTDKLKLPLKEEKLTPTRGTYAPEVDTRPVAESVPLTPPHAGKDRPGARCVTREPVVGEAGPPKFSEDELFEQLVDMYISRIAKNPDDGDLKKKLAKLLSLKGRFAEARRLLKSGDVKTKDASVKDRLQRLTLLVESGDLAPAMEMVEDLFRDLKEKSPLKLVNFAFAESIQGFGLYNERRSRSFRPGEMMILYFEVANFAQESRGEHSHRAVFNVAIRIRDGRGAVRYEKKNFPQVELKTKSRLTDLNLNLREFVPRNLPSGEYTLEVLVTDRIKCYHRKASGTIDFVVK